MLDVAVDPDYQDNGWIYLAYSHALGEGDNRPAMTRVVRGHIRNNAWTDQQVLFEAPHDTYRTSRHHYGSRIVFDAEGRLYFSIGDRGAQSQAQDLSRPNGKVHRIHRDGSIPSDNPFVGRDDALPSIFSYGHRNPQGLAIHPETDALWGVEHGPRGGDELNRIVAGRNYGWPVITYGINYDGTIITEERAREGMEQPVLYWRPSIAVSGLDVYDGQAFPYWRNHLLVGALRDQEVRLLSLAGNHVQHQEVILKNAGRVREAVTGPDGAIYVVVNAPGAILRLSHMRDTTARTE
jgi:glucose/arabinose dehydrogenase